MLNRGLDKQELLRIVDSVANEKSFDKELILSSMAICPKKMKKTYYIMFCITKKVILFHI